MEIRIAALKLDAAAARNTRAAVVIYSVRVCRQRQFKESPRRLRCDYPPTPEASSARLPANMKFFGYGTVPNGHRSARFLAMGEVYIVGEGDTLLGRFRIVRIGNATLEFEELGSGRRNSASLDEQAAPPA